MEELSMWFQAIGNLGFPIAISVYLLIRFEKKIVDLQNWIQELAKITERMERKVE